MVQFDLRKYLANNPLLKEGLTSKEQMIVDDILSVVEGPKDVYNKLTSYGKKGMLSLAVLASVIVGCAEQGDIDSANKTIEYALTNEWAGSDREKIFIAILDYTGTSSDKKSLDASLWAYDALKYNEDLAWEKYNTSYEDYYKRMSSINKEAGEEAKQDIEETKQFIESLIKKFESDPNLTNKLVTQSLEDLKKLDKSEPLYRLVKR